MVNRFDEPCVLTRQHTVYPVTWVLKKCFTNAGINNNDTLVYKAGKNSQGDSSLEMEIRSGNGVTNLFKALHKMSIAFTSKIVFNVFLVFEAS